MPLPIWSMSIVISASSARAVSLITGGVAAVVLVFSVLSIVSFVLSMLVPASLISTVKILPDACAVVSDARTAVSVTALGILNVILLLPAVNAVLSSEAATTSSKGNAASVPSPLTYCDVVPLGVLNLPLNVVQSPELRAPLLLALAVGRLNVCVEVAELMPKSVPAVPTTND